MSGGSPTFTFKPEIIAMSRIRKGYNDKKTIPSERELSEIANVSRATISKYTKEIVDMLMKEEKPNFLLWCENV